MGKRREQTATTYVVTCRTWKRRKLFMDRDMCEFIVETLRDCCDEYDLQLHAFVLMPDHLHLILTPPQDLPLSRAIESIKSSLAQRVHEDVHPRLPVWEYPFERQVIRVAEDYEMCLGAIQQEPVATKLVSRPSDYEWGSASGRFGLDEPPERLKLSVNAADMCPGTAGAAPGERTTGTQAQHILYFSYGSNMLRQRLAEHLATNPDDFGFGERVFAVGWELVFNKPSSKWRAAANIAKKADGIVFGVLYHLRKHHWEKLKDSEGKGYKEATIEVFRRSQVIECFTLVAADPSPNMKPSQEYLERIVEGAREHGISEDYIATIVAKAKMPPSGS